jgi:hypothetical protein
MRTIVAIGKEGLPLLIAGANSWIKPVTSARHNKIHLVEKLTVACSLGAQYKSGGGEGG